MCAPQILLPLTTSRLHSADKMDGSDLEKQADSNPSKDNVKGIEEPSISEPALVLTHKPSSNDDDKENRSLSAIAVNYRKVVDEAKKKLKPGEFDEFNSNERIVIIMRDFIANWKDIYNTF